MNGSWMGLLVLAMSAGAVACELPATERHTVISAVDGRTLQLGDAGELRLAAILAPTGIDSPAAPVMPGELAAVEALAGLARNANVGIALERPAVDRYGRRHGHALLMPPNAPAGEPIETRWVQAQLVRAGQARVALSPETNSPCARLLLELEAAAAAERRGLWAQNLYQPKRAEDRRQLLGLRSTYQIVEGVIVSVSATRSAVYLNFGDSWRQDFTVRIERAILKRGRIPVDAAKGLKRQAVRVRGWLEKRNGPMIRVWRPEEVELLAVRSSGELERGKPLRFLKDLAE